MSQGVDVPVAGAAWQGASFNISIGALHLFGGLATSGRLGNIGQQHVELNQSELPRGQIEWCGL